MKSTFKVLFYVKKDKQKANGNYPIMCRITIDGEQARFNTKAEVKEKNWDSKTGRAFGRSADITKTNYVLDDIRACLHDIYHNMQRQEQVTAEKLKSEFLGHSEKHETLLNLFQKHNDDVKLLVGISKSRATYLKYEVTRKHLSNFIKSKYNMTDIALRSINNMFITDFETYLMTTGKCCHNTTVKFIQFFKRIIIIARNNGLIQHDPFANYKCKLEKVDRGYLTQEEIEIIMSKHFSIKRLEQVRDIFIFSCFTGLSYIDVKNLRVRHIRTSFDGNLWIMTKRQKTNVCSNIPLLDVPKQILKKYEGTLPNEMILPISSNQKMNAYLKEIADVCGIDKNLTFHLARHTFATTVTLAKGVPIETVSKMLGHTNLKTTQIYARITDNKISNDMAVLAEKLKGIETKLVINQ
ncbi:site-specific integrase [Bacteroidales bacterium OttesenSCG-928-K03]|nr:site-specific integrase [Odoribacter sp. OttesenSCG-928-L07]MDL2239923.1 site-specific integrase [Bacteroidales bacterium OttesenSCG-928-L14]MDL2240160.1 site-specific integrase [Bacteroidales bacterium OttesenSCG-928-K22]MDL2242485.1 site-specific integrase [Bacteroidales bacterium OttesenSCG-928-K03]